MYKLDVCLLISKTCERLEQQLLTHPFPMYMTTTEFASLKYLIPSLLLIFFIVVVLFLFFCCFFLGGGARLHPI